MLSLKNVRTCIKAICSLTHISIQRRERFPIKNVERGVNGKFPCIKHDRKKIKIL